MSRCDVISVEDGEETLRADERQIWEATACEDLRANVTVRRSKELVALTRKKRDSWLPGLVERDREASRHFEGFMMATSPDATRALLIRLMTARVERDRIVACAKDLIAAFRLNERPDAAANELERLISSLRENGGW